MVLMFEHLIIDCKYLSYNYLINKMYNINMAKQTAYIYTEVLFSLYSVHTSKSPLCYKSLGLFPVK